MTSASERSKLHVHFLWSVHWSTCLSCSAWCAVRLQRLSLEAGMSQRVQLHIIAMLLSHAPGPISELGTRPACTSAVTDLAAAGVCSGWRGLQSPPSAREHWDELAQHGELHAMQVLVHALRSITTPAGLLVSALGPAGNVWLRNACTSTCLTCMGSSTKFIC